MAGTFQVITVDRQRNGDSLHAGDRLPMGRGRPDVELHLHLGRRGRPGNFLATPIGGRYGCAHQMFHAERGLHRRRRPGGEHPATQR